MRVHAYIHVCTRALVRIQNLTVFAYSFRLVDFLFQYHTPTSIANSAANTPTPTPMAVSLCPVVLAEFCVTVTNEAIVSSLTPALLNSVAVNPAATRTFGGNPRPNSSAAVLF